MSTTDIDSPTKQETQVQTIKFKKMKPSHYQRSKASAYQKINHEYINSLTKDAANDYRNSNVKQKLNDGIISKLEAERILNMHPVSGAKEIYDRTFQISGTEDLLKDGFITEEKALEIKAMSANRGAEAVFKINSQKD